MNENENTSKIPLPGEPEPIERDPFLDFLKEDKWTDVDISADLLDFAEPYKPPRYTLERDGVPFADVGDLHIVTGKPGNGKTGLISQIMACILCGRFGNMRYILSERAQPVLLYIDTEQGKDDTIAIKNRVCSLAGLPYDKALPQFSILRLRDTEEATDRWRKILKAIYLIKPTDIFLDGMLDIVKDYNDQVECQPIVRKCMKIATEYDASLWAVLHENPMVDKLVGTLGSIVQRKVSEIFTVKKIKQSDLKVNERRADMPEIYFKVKQIKARGKDVSNWFFEYVSSAAGWGAPVELNTTETIRYQQDDGTRKQEIREAYDRLAKLNWTANGMTRLALDNALQHQGVTSNRKREDLISLAIDEQFLYKAGTGRPKYFFKADKNPPDDSTRELPFAKPTHDDTPPF